jgi:hypothetical protein
VGRLFDFGTAYRLMCEGEKVRRQDWAEHIFWLEYRAREFGRPKGMYLFSYGYRGHSENLGRSPEVRQEFHYRFWLPHQSEFWERDWYAIDGDRHQLVNPEAVVPDKEYESIFVDA